MAWRILRAAWRMVVERRPSDVAAVFVAGCVGLLAGCGSGDEPSGSGPGGGADPLAGADRAVACGLLSDVQASEVLGTAVSGESGGPYDDEVIARCEWEQPEDSGLGIMLTVSRPDRSAFIARRDDLAGWEPLPDLGDAYVWRDADSQGRDIAMWFAGALSERYALQVVAVGPAATRDQAVTALQVVLGNLGGDGDGTAVTGDSGTSDEAGRPSNGPGDFASCSASAGEDANPTNAVGAGSHPLIEVGTRARWSATGVGDATAMARQLAPLAEVGVIVQSQADDVLVTILDIVPDPEDELACYRDVLSSEGWEAAAVESIDFVSYGSRSNAEGVAAEVPGDLSENDARRICEQAVADIASACVAGTSETDGGRTGVVQLFGVARPDSAAYLQSLLPEGLADSQDIYLAAISTAAIPSEG